MSRAAVHDPPEPTIARTSRWTPAVAAAVGAAVGAGVFLLVHRALIDDAYITLGYVRNVVTHLHWGLIAPETANSATSPFNVLSLAGVTWLLSLGPGGVRPVLGLAVATVVWCALLAGWAAATARRLGRSGAWSAALLAVVLANPFVNSAIGLEVLPIAALLTGLTWAAVAGRPGAFGLLAGLLVLTRLDLGLVVAAVFLLSPAVRGWRPPAIAAAVALPWSAVSWWALGSAIPDTFVIKTLQRGFGDKTFANGLVTLWLDRGLLPLAVALVPAVAGLAVAVTLAVPRVRRRYPDAAGPLVGLVVGGLAWFGAYSLLGVPPYQWYYVPTTVALGIAGVLGGALLLPAPRPFAVGSAVPVGVAVLAGALFAVTSGDRPLPWDRPVYFGSWALPEEYREIGAEVGALVGEDVVEAPGEVGTLAYTCDCTIVDYFSDRGIAVELVADRTEEAGPVMRALLDANFARLDRDDEPLTAQWRLRWTQGAVPAGVTTWPTDSPATGPGTLYLERIG
ncbi:DUF2029 domain-containing protein [Blastococcus sp. URHD0036]|uniref:DUF2029 domain-containing protein n=1 Tax=Blastococcus sp. URHD0036 TaxID=1380356 RepID=UPI00068EAC16|nr:DUF2029 domain-containing protein [Blastococcus sp. URHD0036]